MIVLLSPNEVHYALTLAKRFSKKELWSKKNNKFYKWGAGLLNAGQIPYKAELIGMLGEVAFSKISDLPVDSEFRMRGNNNDFKAKIDVSQREVDIEVKTRLRDFGDVYIKRYDENDKIVSLKSDIYVFCHLQTSWNAIERNIINQERMDPVNVKFDGVISKRRLKTKSIQPAYRGSHKNIVCPADDLADINELINIIL
ncbi:hypothetical protein CMI45_01150 [Candidatus Pacearchaeota archaeon]|nr:hypothetical protein [Candidatus Pacearchaeota archaeon]